MKTLIITLMAQPQEGGGMDMSFMLVLAVCMIIFYFFMMRPQIKKQKEAKSFRESLKKGNKIVTIGGIHGRVETVKENTVVITTEGGGKLKIDRSAISPNSAVNEVEMTNKKA